MHLQKRRIRVIGMGPESESSTDLAMPPQVSPEGTANMRVSKLGEVRRVKGYEELTSSALVSQTGGDTLICRGLYDYDYEGTRRILGVFDDGVDEAEVWHSTDGGPTWARLQSLGSTYVGLYPSFAQWNGSVFMSFGNNVAVQEYDGTAVAAAGATQPTGLAVASGSAGILNGRFGYKFAELDANGQPGPASAAVYVHLVNEQADLSGMSLGAGGVRIYRTPRNSGVFFELVDHNAATYTDDKNSIDLLNEGDEITQIGDAPPTGARYATNHRSRVYYVGSNAEPNGIFPSEIGYPDQVLGSFEQIGEGLAGDELSGVWGPYNGELVLAKLKSMWRLLGAGRNTWELVRTEAATGVASDRSLFHVPAGAIFPGATGEPESIGRASIGYITPERDIRVFDGVTDRIISWAKQDTVRGYNLGARRVAWSVRWPDYDWILFGIPTGASTTVDTVIAWDYARGTWHTIDFLPTINAVALVETSSGGYELIAGTTGGHVLRVFSTWAADGSDITAKLRLRALDFGTPDKTKFLRGVDPVYIPPDSGSQNLVNNVYEGFADTGATAFWTETTAVSGTNENSANPEFMEPKNDDGDYPMDEAFVWELVGTGQKEWGLKVVTFEYQESPETIWRDGDPST